MCASTSAAPHVETVPWTRRARRRETESASCSRTRSFRGRKTPAVYRKETRENDHGLVRRLNIDTIPWYSPFQVLFLLSLRSCSSCAAVSRRDECWQRARMFLKPFSMQESSAVPACRPFLCSLLFHTELVAANPRKDKTQSAISTLYKKFDAYCICKWLVVR